MREEGAPFTVKELALNGADLLGLGLAPEQIGTALHELLLYCAADGRRNQPQTLLMHLKNIYKDALSHV